ncbi:MAG: RNA polymerase factor sigma-54, partial [bacterium]
MLIDALDENGYLTCTLDEVCALCPSEAQVEFEEVTAALALLQSFDPPGVGARSPAECLRLQIDALPVTRAGLPAAAIEALRLARCIVSDHLALLAARDFVRLRRVLEVS